VAILLPSSNVNPNSNYKNQQQSQLEFFDKDCLYEVDNNFVVRLTIDDVDVRNNYDGYFVEIIHKKKVSVCKKFFRSVITWK
jgi:hypothetical protein